jgi:hypothetical protein
MKNWLTLFALVAFFSGARAADPGDEDSDTLPPATNARNEGSEKLSDSGLNVKGVFTSELPGVERKYDLKLLLHPHVGDFTRYDYLRTAIGLRYSISSRLELRGETNVYFAHGLRNAPFFDDYGLVDWRLGGKYHIGHFRGSDWDTAVGGTYQEPIGNPPGQITDGFKHLSPFITFARPVPAHPGLRVFWGLRSDFITHTDIVGRHQKNDLTDSYQELNGGLVWERGAMNYTFETSYATTRVWGNGSDDVFTIRPGFVWAIPRRYTFHSRSQWIFGLGFEVSEGPDGMDWGVGGKLHLSLDFKRMFGHHDKSAVAATH